MGLSRCGETYATTEYKMHIRDLFFISDAWIVVACRAQNGDIYTCLDTDRRYGLIQGYIKKVNFKEMKGGASCDVVETFS